MSHLIRNHPPRRQQGVSTLLIAMLLLAILTIITLFAARYGVNEQRTSGNEYRYKMAFHVAEAGLSQSIEYVKVNTQNMLSTATGGWLDPGAMQWQPCSDATTISPDPCLSEPDPIRRSAMYRFVGTGGTGVLPVNTGTGIPALNSVGGFTASYKSYASLCRMDTTNPNAPVCSLNPTTGDSFYVTVVSRGALTGENATATVRQSFGTFNILGVGAPPAPLMATGGLGSGNMEIIPNPNGAGTGNPISIWANAVVDVSGSFDTCQINEWQASASKVQTPQDVLNGVCNVNECSCQQLPFGYGRISGSYKGSKVKGGDILDTTTHTGADGITYRPSKWYPPDLFQYTFGVPSSEGTAFLTANATPINGCGSLNANSSGFFWNASGTCSVGSAGTIQRPVVLVSDTPVTLAAQSQFFGMIYVRNTSATSFTANGNWQIYGAVITEGEAKLTGTPSLIYSKLVLDNIRNAPGFVRYGPVPGSWSDSFPDQ